MKQYPVLNNFIDRHTKEYYPEGSTYFTNDAERAQELFDLGFVGEEVKPKRKNAKQADKSGETNESE
ncbi:hypothetical protein [Bacillus smithii]|uniref:hypothetical protein n=1 Tax=Bacillus smithii TaxID=1479 RepID=UPI0030C9C6DD